MIIKNNTLVSIESTEKIYDESYQKVKNHIITLSYSKESMINAFEMFLKIEPVINLHKMKIDINNLIDFIWFNKKSDLRITINIISDMVCTSTNLLKTSKTKYYQQHICIMNTIWTKILQNIINDNTMEYYLRTIESNLEDTFDDFYFYLINFNDLNQYQFNSQTLKIILKMIVESYTWSKICNDINKNNSISNEQKIDNLLNILNIKNIDDIFDGDLPFNKSILLNQNNNLFNVLEPIAKVCVLGCTHTLSLLLNESRKHNDQDLLKNLLNISVRYSSTQCCSYLNFLLKNVIVNKNDNQRNNANIIDNKNNKENNNDISKKNYVDLSLVCVKFRIYCSSNNDILSSCNIL